MSPYQFLAALLVLWVASLCILVALSEAWAWLSLALRRAYWRRSRLGYPPDGGPPRYVVRPGR